MPDVKEVAARVYRLEMPIARMPGATVVYLIDEPGGALIEPGPDPRGYRDAVSHKSDWQSSV